MIKNHLLVAWRTLRKNKLFSAINVIGLALSMSICMIVIIRLLDALSYDTFHRDEEAIFRINSVITTDQHGTTHLASSPLPLASRLRDEKSVVLHATTIYRGVHEMATDSIKEFSISGRFGWIKTGMMLTSLRRLGC